MQIAMIGTGYVGLVSGACFSEFGIDVVCVDMDAEKIARLEDGQVPIYEPGLDVLVANNVECRQVVVYDGPQCGRRKFRRRVHRGGHAEPPGDGHADLSYVHAAAAQIAEALDGYTVVVTKSTVPVGTGNDVERIIRETRPDADYDVVSNPEFLREGSAIEDFMRPDRVVIGTDSDAAKSVMHSLYRPLSLIETPILFTNRETAELIKYATNAFLATKISFINELQTLRTKSAPTSGMCLKGWGWTAGSGVSFCIPGQAMAARVFRRIRWRWLRRRRLAGAPIRIVEAVVDINTDRKKAMASRIIYRMRWRCRGQDHRHTRADL